MRIGRRAWYHGLAATVVTCAACGNDTNDGGSFTLTHTYCADWPVAWAAMQDGNGPWRQVLPISGMTYEFEFTQDRGAIAVVVVRPSHTSLEIQYATIADLGKSTLTSQWFPCGFWDDKRVFATLAGVTDDDGVWISTKGLGQFLTPSTFPIVELVTPAGPFDLLAARRSPAGAPFPDRIILRHGVEVEAGGMIAPVLDFSAGTDAADAAMASFTVTGLGAGDDGYVTSGITGNNPGWYPETVSSTEYNATSGTLIYAAVPLSLLSSTDIQSLGGDFSPFSAPNTSRGAVAYFREAVAQTLTLGPPLATPTVTTVATTPSVRPRIQFPVQPEYSDAMGVSFGQQSTGKYVDISVTAAYFGAPTTWDLTVPDLSGLPGWNSDWGLVDGEVITWGTSAWDGPRNHYAEQVPDGATLRIASMHSTSPLMIRERPGALGPGRPPSRTGMPR